MPVHLQLASNSADYAHAPAPITVVLADDHAGVRRSLRSLLDSEDDIYVVAETAELTSAVSQVHDLTPDVLVLDLGMPGKRRAELIPELRTAEPNTEIVVLTMEQSAAFAHQALEAGAVGFVLKDRADSDLPPAIRTAAGHEEFVSPKVAGALSAMRAAVGDGLSPRETEVLRLIALGHTSIEIGHRLRLSRRTVETHRARIYAKLGMKTRSDLVSYALKRRLMRE